MPGARPNEVVSSTLSMLLAAEVIEPGPFTVMHQLHFPPVKAFSSCLARIQLKTYCEGNTEMALLHAEAEHEIASTMTFAAKCIS